MTSTRDIPSYNREFQERFIGACENGDLSSVDLILQKNLVDPSAYNNWAIITTSFKWRLNILERLLQDERVDPSVMDNRLIQSASCYGHYEYVKLLLQDYRVDPSANNSYAIRSARFNGYINIILLLLQDKRVDKLSLHLPSYSKSVNPFYLTHETLPIISTIPVPFPPSSPIISWEPHIIAYREEVISLMNGLNNFLYTEILDDIIGRYLFDMRFTEYIELDTTIDE